MANRFSIRSIIDLQITLLFIDREYEVRGPSTVLVVVLVVVVLVIVIYLKKTFKSRLFL